MALWNKQLTNCLLTVASAEAASAFYLAMYMLLAEPAAVLIMLINVLMLKALVVMITGESPGA